MALPAVITTLGIGWCPAIAVTAGAAALLLTPHDVMQGPNAGLAVAFAVLFGISASCSARAMKERAVAARRSGVSGLGIGAAVLGITALRVCGLGAPVCGTAVGTGIISAILPGFMLRVLYTHGVALVAVSLAVQLVSLWTMHCFTPMRRETKGAHL